MAGSLASGLHSGSFSANPKSVADPSPAVAPRKGREIDPDGGRLSRPAGRAFTRPLSGLALYKNEKAYFYFDRNTYAQPVAKYLLYKLSKKQLKDKEKQHEMFLRYVGNNSDYKQGKLSKKLKRYTDPLFPTQMWGKLLNTPPKLINKRIKRKKKIARKKYLKGLLYGTITIITLYTVLYVINIL